MGDAEVNISRMSFGTHWGSLDESKQQDSLESRTGQRSHSSSAPGQAGSVPSPSGSACILGLWFTTVLVTRKEDDQQDNQDDEQATSHC